jgi:hypothetical protein
VSEVTFLVEFHISILYIYVAVKYTEFSDTTGCNPSNSYKQLNVGATIRPEGTPSFL